MDFLKEILKSFVFWYMTIGPAVLFVLSLLAYDHPEYGFNVPGLKTTPLLIVFPVIWLVVFVYTKYVVYKREKQNPVNAEEVQS